MGLLIFSFLVCVPVGRPSVGAVYQEHPEEQEAVTAAAPGVWTDQERDSAQQASQAAGQSSLLLYLSFELFWGQAPLGCFWVQWLACVSGMQLT